MSYRQLERLADGHIGVIGLGKLGRRIALRLYQEGYPVIGSARHGMELEGIETTTDNSYLAEKSSIIVVAVKQPDFFQVAEEIRAYADGKLLLSAMAAFELAGIDNTLPARNARIMTNLEYARGNGSSGYCLGSRCTAMDEIAIQEILSAGGDCYRLREEEMRDMTLDSGCALGFVAKVTEYFLAASDQLGMLKSLSQKQKRRIYGRLLIGIGSAMLDGKDPSEIAVSVASKGGMTEAGYKKMEQWGMREAILETYHMALERERELQELLKGLDKNNG
ncbi:MAG: NAD(P)-binding domain-containing protein [Candidatus Aenigmarchaeota archaeon]|nr:NAD(P)-binding domain-containing protein [Candidatus Aenigmarchaeota archaeon]